MPQLPRALTIHLQHLFGLGVLGGCAAAILYVDSDQIWSDTDTGILVLLLLVAYFLFLLPSAREELAEERRSEEQYRVLVAQGQAREREQEEQRRESERRRAENRSAMEIWTELPIPTEGPPAFVESIQRAFSVLHERAPHRYEEAKEYLPKARWAPEIRAPRANGHSVVANSGGNFAITMQENGEEYFVWVFAHEVGHNVAGRQRGDHSEEAANAYADQVVREVGME